MVGFLACLTGPAQADSVTVFEPNDCSTLNFYTALQNQDGNLRRAPYFLYVAGLLSGKAVSTREDFLRDVSIKAVEEEVVSLCKLRPTASITDIARQIEKKLRSQ